ncbi:MAG TPA: rhodanese-like domain-containing protein [Bacteroidales bacterium]|nr:rhodanese-like domain-containing protein [Bacteroidales bacterium]
MNSNNKLFFASSGFQSAGFLNLTPKEAYYETQNNAILVDVREEELTGYKQFDVPKTIFLPISLITEKFSELPGDKPVIIADSAGLRSKEAMIFLAGKNFKNIANLAGGLVEWERDGLPLLINPKEKLDGSCVCQLKPRTK